MRLSLSGGTLVLLWLFLSGCAATPAQQQREADKSQAIEAILTEASEFSETERCLGPNEFRDVRILDDQHILFTGRRGKMWLNTLPMRCPDLRRNSVLRVERLSVLSSLCHLDSFEVHDWFDSPWYRRWPWATGARCSLGAFQPVNEVQVQALQDAIKAGRGG